LDEKLKESRWEEGTGHLLDDDYSSVTDELTKVMPDIQYMYI
jgi:hypothetical protein